MTEGMHHALRALCVVDVDYLLLVPGHLQCLQSERGLPVQIAVVCVGLNCLLRALLQTDSPHLSISAASGRICSRGRHFCCCLPNERRR